MTVGLLLAVMPVLVQHWDASWIAVPGAPEQDYGVYHFRRSFDLSEKPATFPIRVSADNRYQLFVNGARVRSGPERGDLSHWRYDSLDIAPQLHPGNNVLAAVVWNDGPKRAVAQISNRTGFLLEGPGIATNASWKCIPDAAYTAQFAPARDAIGYYALGPNERFDASLYPWGWEQPGFDDSSWKAAAPFSHAANRDASDAPNRWMLVENQLPAQQETPEKSLTVRDGPPLPLTVPAHSASWVLLDQGYLTTAYPELSVSGGRGARVDLRYAETLFESRTPTVKGNRNDIAGKQFYGVFDSYIADGAARTYRPLYWRTYRYLKLDIETGGEPLSIQSVRGTFTGYPFERKAQFSADAGNGDIQRILNTGWHTARLCAHETYMDCPYYEQLQYAGDARIQMLISIYTTGDTRLMKNGIALLNSSRTAEGATFSRAPSALQQYIPPFSLWWVGMVHDYWYYAADPDFVREMLPGVRAVLSFYGRYQKANGSLAHMPWWNFVDWVPQWKGGVPPAEPDGSSSAALDLQLALAYQWAADLESGLGEPGLAASYAKGADQLKRTVEETDWDGARGLYADQPSHQTFSQHVNTLALMAGLKPYDVAEKLQDPSIAQASIYFRAYTNAVLPGDRYLDELGPWRHMLTQGLTTWAEWDGPDVRSDCHAWGASPNYELLRTVAGITSAAPGFQRVRIEPHLGNLNEVNASMPHPAGQIKVKINKAAKHVSADIALPEGTSGVFVWAGRERELHPGENQVRF